MTTALANSGYQAIVFAGGGCRCFWQAGFWSIVQPVLGLTPKLVGAVSAGAAIACAAFSGVLEAVLEDFLRRTAHNRRNLYPQNLFRGVPLFPHEQMYRATIHEQISDAALLRLREGPEIRVFLARAPQWTGPMSGFGLGMVAYSLDRNRTGLHPTWGKKLGFSGDWVSANQCATGDELVDLILQSSCTPPITPICRRDGRIVFDGGLVDNVPDRIVAEAVSTLVLLSRQYKPSAIPDAFGHTYVQPSQPLPIWSWDYTNPDLIQKTFDLGRRDGERFAKSLDALPPRA